jgi:hypothetical protein
MFRDSSENGKKGYATVSVCNHSFPDMFVGTFANRDSRLEHIYNLQFASFSRSRFGSFIRMTSSDEEDLVYGFQEAKVNIEIDQ